MADTYDVIVAGAGPAGLVAAWKAAEKGLRVLLVEKKSDPAEAVRTTGNAFRNRSAMNGEMVSVSKKGDQAVIHFHASDFDVPYSGRLIEAYDRYSFSNSGYCVRTTRSDYPQQYFYDMSVLQGDLLKKALGAGAEILAGCLAIGAENEKNRVRLKVKRNGAQSAFFASRLIAADGLNSRLAEAMGLNKDRPVIVKGPVLEMVYGNVEFPYPPGFAFVLGSDMKGGDGHMFIYPHAMDDGAFAVMVNCRFPASKCPDRIRHFTAKSKFASWFARSRHIGTTAAVVTVRPPVKKPVIGNVLFIGDAPAYGETLVAGAMFCGFHAAEAVCRDLSGENGFGRYCDLWASSFDFVADPQKQKDYTKILRLYARLADADLDYLFRLSSDSGPIDTTGQQAASNEYSGGNIMIDHFLGFPQVSGALRSALQEIRNS